MKSLPYKIGITKVWRQRSLRKLQGVRRFDNILSSCIDVASQARVDFGVFTVNVAGTVNLDKKPRGRHCFSNILEKRFAWHVGSVFGSHSTQKPNIAKFLTHRFDECKIHQHMSFNGRFSSVRTPKPLLAILPESNES